MMVLKCIVVLALVIVIDCYASTEIERGDHDTFENPTCFSETGGCNCDGLNAYCFDLPCVKCKCSGEYKTFLPSASVGKHGSCVKDIYLLFFPINTSSFLVQETRKKMCLTHWLSNKYFVIGTTCNSNDPAQHWIWTQYNQLLNLDTLKCLQQGTSTTWYRYIWKTYYYLILGNCDTTDIKQTWDCADSNYIFRITPTNSYKYMSYGVDGSYILAGPYYSSLYTTWQRRHQFGATLCSKAFGCNEFSNPSSAIFVTDINCTQCQGEKQINVPQNYYNCKIVWDQSKFLGYGWNQLPFTEKIFTIVHYGVHNGRDTFLKWNFTNASYKWSGLIVKLQFSCTDQSSGHQLDKCILIKFKGKHTDPTAAPPTEPSTRVVSTKFSTTAKTPTSGALLTTASTPDEIKPTPTLSPRPTSFPSPTNPTDEIKPTPTLSPRPTSFPSPTDGSSPLTSKMSNTTSVRERQKSEPLNVVSIVVPLVVIILVLCGVLGFIFYKRRRSHAKESPAAKDQDANDKGGSSVRQTADTLNPIYSPADNSFAPHCSDDGGAYQEPTSGVSQVCNLYESGGDHDYDYAKVDQNDHRAPVPEETYDYANSNDIRPVAQPNAGINKKTPKHVCESKVEGEENTCPLYQTLGDSSANGFEMSPITNNNKKDPNESNVEGGEENMSPVYQTLEDPYENE